MGEYGEYGFDQQGWYGMFVACGIWCIATPYPTGDKHTISTLLYQVFTYTVYNMY